MQIVLCSFGFVFCPDGPKLILTARSDVQVEAPWDLVLRVSDLEAAPTFKDGTDSEVRAQIIELNKERVEGITRFVCETVDSWEGVLSASDRPLYLAFGCGYGMHRSVSIVEHLAEVFRREGHDVKIIHLTLEKARERFSKLFPKSQGEERIIIASSG